MSLLFENQHYKYLVADKMIQLEVFKFGNRKNREPYLLKRHYLKQFSILETTY